MTITYQIFRNSDGRIFAEGACGLDSFLRLVEIALLSSKELRDEYRINVKVISL